MKRRGNVMPARISVHASWGTRRNACGDERGVSLIELMIALGISAILVGGAYSMIYNSQQIQTINEQAVQAQQNGRTAMELIAQDLKDAGFNSQNLAPPGIGTAGAAGTCGINGILPRDNNTGGADTGPDSVSMIVPTMLSTLLTPITGAAPTTDVVLQNGAVAAAGGDGFLVAPYDLPNPVISIAGFHTGTVSAVNTDTLSLSAQVKLPRDAIMPGNALGTGMQVYWLKCVMYKVIHASSNATTEQPLCGGTLPCLVRGTPPCLTTQTGPACVAVVDGIEDLQLSYACDGCVGTEDGVIDDQAGGTASFDANDFVSNNAWNAGAFLPKTIRMVQVSVVARQVGTTLGSESVGGAKAQFSPVPLVVSPDHNHANGVFVAGDLGTAAAQGAYSQIMRRVLNRTVQLKNMGLF